MRLIILSFCLCASLVSANECLVVAHRGASAYLPEHTLESYQLAIEQGADYIEPDVVLTKDGVPIVRHEVLLDLTTDVASRKEYAARRSSRTFYGKEIEGWFVDDFTLAEIKTLRARERWPEIRTDSASRDGEFAIPTLAEVIALAQTAKRPVGLYIEFKDPKYFSKRNLDIVEKVVAELGAANLNHANAAVILQSFEPAALKQVADLSPLLRIQLLESDVDLDLAQIASYAQGIGIPKYDFDVSYDLAHELGLQVHVYTFRAEAPFLQNQYRGDLGAEIEVFLQRGMDGFFTDNPDIGRAVCDAR